MSDTGPGNALPFIKTADGIVVTIRLTPKASRDRVIGLDKLSDGTVVLKVAVTAVPEKGKANKALLKLLAKSWGVGIQRLDLIRGAKDRIKTVLVTDDPASGLRKLTAWADGFETPAT